MIVAGIDIGSVATKVVILETQKHRRENRNAEEKFVENRLLAQAICPTGANPKLAAKEVLEKALGQANLSRENLEYIVSTGYGRRAIEFGNKTVTEISCCAKGARWIGTSLGEVRTIVDLGGQDMKVISLEEDGTMADFVMNDKCSAGTGRFLEVMANVLGMGLENLGELSLKSKNPIQINSTCTAFAESEVISLIAQGKNKEDIIAGIHFSIAERIVNMVRQVGEKEVVFFCGGGAKNRGVHKALEDRLDMKVYVPDEPQFIIALGAALIAKEIQNARLSEPRLPKPYSGQESGGQAK